MIGRESVAIDAVEAGVRLATSVQDAAGAVLLPAGTLLTEALLQGLRRRGVSELQIETKLDEDPAIVEARRVTLESKLDQLFRKAGNGAETLALYRAIRDFRLERGA